TVLATGGNDQAVHVWNANGTLEKALPVAGTEIRALTFTDNSRALLVAGRQVVAGKPAFCGILNLDGKVQVKFTGHTSAFAGALAPGGRLAATAGPQGDDVFVW